MTREHERDAAIAAVGQYCDIERRLMLLPPSAKIRGLFFRSIEQVLAEAKRLAPYRALFPERFSALAFHPMSAFLVRLTVAGGILIAPEQVHEGMFEIGRRNARAFAESMLGRLLLRVLAPDPRKLLQQALAGRRQSAQPARWELVLRDERTAVMEMREEYLYIESYQRGAALGTFEAVSIEATVEVELDDAFNGRHIVRW